MADGDARPLAGVGYKRWVLTILVIVYTSNFIDRTIINILGQSIKVDLKLSDGQLGWLSGLSFAILYSTLGVPIARLAERFHRVSIISISLVLWSGFTALCGLATNFWQLFAARVGVGIGEAGCSPAAQSVISDYYPPHQRASALAVYSLGIPFGSLFGALAGGMIAQAFSWREAFMLVGLPGILLAIVLQLTLREPPRGAYDPPVATGSPTPPLSAVFKRLWEARSFRHVVMGATLASFGGYGIGAFAVPFLLRGDFGMDLVKAATGFGVFGGLAMAVGVALGGFITDWAGKRDPRSYALVPGFGFLIAAPLYVAAFLQSNMVALGAIIIVPLIIQYLYLGPTFAVTHNLVEPRMRASATALLFLPINLVGLGFGPPFVGWISDMVSKASFTGAGDFAAACPGGVAPAASDAALKAACAVANFEGPKWAIVITAGAIFAWAGIHYLLAARNLKRDLEP